MAELKDRFEELVAFLKSQGHSDERAKQIAGNHPEAVAEELDKSQKPANEAEPDESKFEVALAEMCDELRAEFKKQRGA